MVFDPTILETLQRLHAAALASGDPEPNAINVGNVTSVPDPTMALIPPAHNPARKISPISSALTRQPYEAAAVGRARPRREAAGTAPVSGPGS